MIITVNNIALKIAHKSADIIKDFVLCDLILL